MRRALELAQPHHTHPNPKVGAVVVTASGEIVGEGAHARAGEDHAEVVALDDAGARSAGATLYVTLEPCVHHGRTPPCTEAIVKAGVGRVVVAMTDPDEKVAGAGIAGLREAGIEVTESVLGDEAETMNAAYVHHRRTGLPRVTLKYAMTLDGSVAAMDRTSQWITSEEARADAHELRAASDAVVIGAGTLRTDDPKLDVRIASYEGPQPVPVIIAGIEPLPTDAAIWERDPVVVATSEIEIPSGRLVLVEGSDGNPDPTEAARALAGLGLLEILIEGGPTLATAWWKVGVVTRGVVYLGAKLGGGGGIPPLAGVFAHIEDAEQVSITHTRNLGSDFRIDFVRG